ncbi:M56 family metallopeptidase [Acidicapsa acidisoli]|uniref:M56 family metallopeptidase n=1 Tax=Acidicapsa acidisoli TaxID=1615681 RepID=UPI0021DFDE75|nr:M56 family metallopeptidase [Acidicapsa acidisoli]
MSGLAVNWLTYDESLALGWTLLHFCWQGAIVALMFACADRMTLRASSGIRYALALGALALMPATVMTTFAIEMRDMAPSRAVENGGQAMQVTFMPPLQPSINHSSPVTLVDGAQSPEGWLASHTRLLLPWIPWIDGIWMLGILLLAVRAAGGWWHLEKLRRTACGVVPDDVKASLLHVCKRVNVGSEIILRVSDRVISPMVMGVWQSTVILPVSAILHLSREELEAVLAHELGHIRRWDYACNLLQTALETLLFFHPAVWWISGIVRDRREVCCDEIAVKSCSDPVVYAQTLLRLEEEKARGLELAVAFKGRGGVLLGRIEKVLGGVEPMEHRITGGVRLAAVSVVMFGLLFGPKIREAIAASQPTPDRIVAIKPAASSIIVDPNFDPTMQQGASADKFQTRRAVMQVGGQASKPAGVQKAVEVSSLRAGGGRSSELTMMQAEAKTETRSESKGISYIDGMRDAGYPLDLNNDLNTLISLKSLGVTPEYAKAMGALGFGKPSVHELLSLKALGVTPEYVAELKQSGLGAKDFHEVTTEKALGITPEYAAAMKKTDFGDLNLRDLISLKAQGVTPEYVGWLKQQFPKITMDELRRAAVFHLDDKFLAQAKSHGFDGKDLDKLLRLKMSGLLDEE